jgi:hypothetical protein
MIGAALALAEATGDMSFLADAQLIAGFSAKSETTSSPDGPVLFDGTNAGCGGDCEQFKGILARFLAQLDPIAQGSWSGLTASSAASIWDRARSGDDRFATDWAEAPPTATSLAAQSSAVAALNAYARELGPLGPPATSVYEAEEASITGIGLEASHAGFSGWGYLAGWNGSGQAASFRIHRSAAGSAHLVLHYAAAAGDAIRAISVDGATVIAKQKLASTGSWDAWSDLAIDLTLPAGDSTLTIAFDGSSSSYLNLDAITIAN